MVSFNGVYRIYILHYNGDRYTYVGVNAISYTAKYWYANDKCHRINKPAIEYGSGAKYWYQNGKLHRENGPAIEYANGANFYYRYGKPTQTV